MRVQCTNEWAIWFIVLEAMDRCLHFAVDYFWSDAIKLSLIQHQSEGPSLYQVIYLFFFVGWLFWVQMSGHPGFAPLVAEIPPLLHPAMVHHARLRFHFGSVCSEKLFPMTKFVSADAPILTAFRCECFI